MAIFDFFKRNPQTTTQNTPKLSNNWTVLVQEKKANTKMVSVVTQKNIYNLLRRTFTCLEPFFATLQFDFHDLDEHIKSNEDVERIMFVLSQVCLRFNSGFHAMKPEAIERYLNALNNEDLIMAYIGIEYYKDSIEDNSSLGSTLKIAERVLVSRSI